MSINILASLILSIDYFSMTHNKDYFFSIKSLISSSSSIGFPINDSASSFYVFHAGYEGAEKQKWPYSKKVIFFAEKIQKN